MDNIIFAKYDMDSGFVQAWTENCNLILIDCDAVENDYSGAAKRPVRCSLSTLSGDR